MSRRSLLLPYQARIVADKSPVVVVEKSRRIGVSWALAWRAARDAAPAKGAVNTFYMAYARDMTETFVDDAKEGLERIQVAASEVGEEVWDEEGRAAARHSVSAASGARVVGLSGAARQFRSRGRPGERFVIDEAAWVDDLETMLTAARGVRTWGGQLAIVSTHNGSGNPFNRLARDIEAGRRTGSLHRVTFQQAIDEGLYRKICEVTGQPWTPELEEAWAAEIRAEYGADAAEELDVVPSAGDGTWLSWPMITGCEHERAGDPLASNRGGAVWIGVDVAVRRNLWVAVVLEEIGDVLWLRDMRMLRPAPLELQEQTLAELEDHWRVSRFVIDQTGMGEFVVERMKKLFGDMRVEGVILSGARRLDVATALRQRMEDRKLRIPADTGLRADLRSIRAEQGPTGGPRLIAGTEKDGSHADRFWALALACAAAGGKIIYAYTPVREAERDEYGRHGRFRDRPRGEWDSWIGGDAGSAAA